MDTFKPYADEDTSIAIDDLTIENRLDRIELYGSLLITRDLAGLRSARELKALVDTIVNTLEQQALPEQIAPPDVESVRNPFE